MRIDKDGVVHFDTGGGDFSGFGDGSSQGGGYNDGGGDVNFADISADIDAATTPSTESRSFDPTTPVSADFDPAGLNTAALSPASQADLQSMIDILGYGLNESIPGMGASQTGPMHSPGLSYATLNVLNDIGLGKMDIPGFGQNVEQALAANNVATAMGYIAPAIANLAPGFGTLSTIGRVGAGLMSGTMTPGQAFATGLAGLIGAKTNIPSGIVEGLFEGNLGKAAGSGAQAGLGALTTGLTGNPLAGALASATLGPAVGRAVSDAVGGGSSKSGGLAGAVDRGLGTSNWGGLFGGASAPSTSTAPTGNASGDAGINPDIYSVTAAIEQAAQEATQPSWKRETVAGRYGPTVQYEFGA